MTAETSRGSAGTDLVCSPAGTPTGALPASYTGQRVGWAAWLGEKLAVVTLVPHGERLRPRAWKSRFAEAQVAL